MIKEIYFNPHLGLSEIRYRGTVCESEIANENQYETKTKSVKVAFYFHPLKFCSIVISSVTTSIASKKLVKEIPP